MKKKLEVYYAALEKVEQSAAAGHLVTEKMIQTLHSLVVADGKVKVRPTPPYRDSQNVIRDGRTRAIVYMPPEANDVSSLMRSMVLWIREAQNIPCPIVAAIARYQFATIHPYYDGKRKDSKAANNPHFAFR